MPRIYTRKPIADRFWAMVHERPFDCWIWKGATSNGYGTFQLGRGKGTIIASRFAWELFYGPIPDGLFVLHKCDIPACVRPGHLFLGTQKENMEDMRSKGRGFVLPPQKGSAHHAALLTEETVREARDRYLHGGERVVDLADSYGVSLGAMKKAVYRQTWRHVA